MQIYIEEKIRSDPRTAAILDNIPQYRNKSADIIYIKSYMDVFNRHSQDYHVQYMTGNIILARKEGQLIYRGAPVCQDFGNRYFYYTSSVMNCVYDCEYCFLKGMYSCGYKVIFVNIDDIFSEAEKILKKHDAYISISYDTDLMAFENITGYLKRWMSFTYSHPGLSIEIRTKNANVPLLRRLSKTCSPERPKRSENSKTPLHNDVSPEYIRYACMKNKDREEGKNNEADSDIEANADNEGSAGSENSSYGKVNEVSKEAAYGKVNEVSKEAAYVEVNAGSEDSLYDKVIAVNNDVAEKKRVIFAFSVNPDEIISLFEHGTPSLEKRCAALNEAYMAGFSVRLCFDPMIYEPDWRKYYSDMTDTVFRIIDPHILKDVSLGSFRISREYLKEMRKKMPVSRAVQFPFLLKNGFYQYPDRLEKNMQDFLYKKLTAYVSPEKIFIWDHA